jgi:hypothetical protein
MCSNRNLFRQIALQKRGRDIFGLRLVRKEFQHPAIQPKMEQHFGGFFSNKSALANRKTGSEQAGGWIQFRMKQLRTLNSFQISKSEI